MRLIDADAFLKSEIERCGCVPVIGSCTSDNEIFKFILEEQPTVEAVPVVHGEWKFNHFYGEWECSECGSLIALSDDENGHANFCPNCGADMRSRKKGNIKCYLSEKIN